MSVRSTAERVAHARARLAAESNVWIATASPDGVAHLVPLSLAWLSGHIVVATPADTPTARNAGATGRARAALDGAEDVVVFDVTIDVVGLGAADAALRAGYVDTVGWDPADNPGDWVLLVMAPQRGHAWNSPAEMHGRTIVRNGAWLD